MSIKDWSTGKKIGIFGGSAAAAIALVAIMVSSAKKKAKKAADDAAAAAALAAANTPAPVAPPAPANNGNCLNQNPQSGGNNGENNNQCMPQCGTNGGQYSGGQPAYGGGQPPYQPQQCAPVLGCANYNPNYQQPQGGYSSQPPVQAPTIPNVIGSWQGDVGNPVNMTDNGQTGNITGHPLGANLPFSWTGNYTFNVPAFNDVNNPAYAGNTSLANPAILGNGTLSADGSTISWDNGSTWTRNATGGMSADGYSANAVRSTTTKPAAKVAAAKPSKFDGQWYDKNYNLLKIVNGMVINSPVVANRKIPIISTPTTVAWGGEKGTISKNGDTLSWRGAGKWTKVSASPKPSTGQIATLKKYLANPSANKSLKAGLMAAKLISVVGQVNTHAHSMTPPLNLFGAKRKLKPVVVRKPVVKKSADGFNASGSEIEVGELKWMD